jgi:hypothetical protein
MSFERSEKVDGRVKPGHDEVLVIARSEATKQSSFCLHHWIASLRSQ